MPLDDTHSSFGEKIAKISTTLLRLGSGSLARLRRMEVTGPGETEFWQLAKSCDFLNDIKEDKWLRLVKLMALLTPKGERKSGHVLHDSTRAFGELLCDGGNRHWQGGKPFYSEPRLARFLALPFERRGEALERMARMLASSRDPNTGVNCVDIACLLFSSDTKHVRKITRAYYQRLDFSHETYNKDQVT